MAQSCAGDWFTGHLCVAQGKDITTVTSRLPVWLIASEAIDLEVLSFTNGCLGLVLVGVGHRARLTQG
jgi:hypothetical protein